MTPTFAVYGQDPATDVVEALGTFASAMDANRFAVETCEQVAERHINRGVEGVRWLAADPGRRYEVWSADGLAYLVTIEEVEPGEEP
ncbi:MAG: hypothetical protein WBA46_12970 [Thermomicrobiales bacterium]